MSLSVDLYLCDLREGERDEEEEEEEEEEEGRFK